MAVSCNAPPVQYLAPPAPTPVAVVHALTITTYSTAPAGQLAHLPIIQSQSAKHATPVFLPVSPVLIKHCAVLLFLGITCIWVPV